jgi:hypothetical protein
LDTIIGLSRRHAFAIAEKTTGNALMATANNFHLNISERQGKFSPSAQLSVRQTTFYDRLFRFQTNGVE